MTARLLSFITALSVVLPGCPSASSGIPCNLDVDCPAGNFCAPGGCAFVCRADLDCIAMGEDFMCTEVGRCERPLPCVTPDDCQDGVRCNGSEGCDATSPEADSRGCTPPLDPACAEGFACTEEGGCDRCANPDRDGDMQASVECGGDDCDDTDPNVHAGALEICDDDDVDEDCDPVSVGLRDRDSDGFTSDECCNRAEVGMRCGDDCADDPRPIAEGGDGPDAPARHRTNPELCDFLDNDCDGLVDEGVVDVVFYDLDNDGVGANGSGHSGCVEALRENEEAVDGDCDDGDSRTRPGAPERCDDRLDSNCNGDTGDGCGCEVGESSTCGTTEVGPCTTASVDCGAGGAFPPCVAVFPESSASRQCGEDRDCDGNAYENIACVPGTSRGCAMCGAGPTPFDGRGHEDCRSDCDYTGTCVTGGGGSFTPTYERSSGFSGWSEPCRGYPDSGGYRVPYDWFSSPIACVLMEQSAILPAGTYRIYIRNFDTAVQVTPQVAVEVRGFDGGLIMPRMNLGNTNAGWETHTFTFGVSGCTAVGIVIGEVTTPYGGRHYLGGNTVVGLDIVREGGP